MAKIKNLNASDLTMGKPKFKTWRGGHYIMLPFFYGRGLAFFSIEGKMKIFEHQNNSFSLGIDVDDTEAFDDVETTLMQCAMERKFDIGKLPHGSTAINCRSEDFRIVKKGKIWGKIYQEKKDLPVGVSFFGKATLIMKHLYLGEACKSITLVVQDVVQK